MLIVIFGIAFLLLGYFFYSRLLERIIKPYQEPTLAYTKGDTALRSARMMVQDDRGFDTKDMKTTLVITLVLTALIVLLTCWISQSCGITSYG